MAFRIIWTETATDDLHTIVRYIASDDPDAARRIGARILDRIDDAATFQLAGRMVPEKEDPGIREVLLNPYRLIYTVDESMQVLHLVRIWHAARGTPVIE